ncbi:FecR family protein [Acetobacter senegalensis]|uniref:FecR family protein n=1 Tax=Acetobacter senegalensis TaxID=446692 RepID=UPI00264A7784|nr:DUF4880 domain-containing protein [Acetobacter senegalensis]MDN7351866.1 DUF4880 domain-containing protein [Acetobacter senegalensis]
MKKKSTPDEIAAHWMARLDRRNLTPDEESMLQDWIGADVRHKGAFLRHQAIWYATNRARALQSPAIVRNQRKFLLSKRMFCATAVAASFGAFFVPVGTAEAIISYETDRNILHSSTKWRRKLTLDCHTRIQDSSCETILLLGRCYVTAGEGLVKTANLRFAISGSLLVSQVGNFESGVVVSGSAMVWGRSLSDRKYLAKGTRITVTPYGALQFSHLDKEELARLTAWTTGQVALETETILEAADIFNRYNKKQIVPSFRLEDQRISGLFDLYRPDIFAQATKSIAGARVIEDSHHLYLE